MADPVLQVQVVPLEAEGRPAGEAQAGSAGEAEARAEDASHAALLSHVEHADAEPAEGRPAAAARRPEGAATGEWPLFAKGTARGHEDAASADDALHRDDGDERVDEDGQVPLPRKAEDQGS